MTEKQYLIDAITMHDSWRLFKILAEFVDGFETLGELTRLSPFSDRPALSLVMTLMKKHIRSPKNSPSTDTI